MHRPLALRNTALIASLLSILGLYATLTGVALGSGMLTSRGLYLLLASLPLQLYTLLTIAANPAAAVTGLNTLCLRAVFATGVSLGTLYAPLLAALAARSAAIALAASEAGVGVGLHCRQRWIHLVALWPIAAPILAVRAASCIESLLNGLELALALRVDWESLSGVEARVEDGGEVNG